MSEEMRVCRCCAKEKPIRDFYNQKKGTFLDCKKCTNKKTVARRKSTPEKLSANKERVKRWKMNHPEAVRASNRRGHQKWRESHREASRALTKAWKKKNERTLGNSYVAKRLGMRTALVPPPLLDAMRELIKSHRILYQIRTKKQNAPETK